VISIDVKSMIADCDVAAVEMLVPNGDIGMTRIPDEGTNTVAVDLVVSTVATSWRVSRTVDYAMSHYEDLLVRLAD